VDLLRSILRRFAVDMDIHGYIHEYYTGALAEYLYALCFYDIFLSVVFTLHFLFIYVTESNE